MNKRWIILEPAMGVYVIKEDNPSQGWWWYAITRKRYANYWEAYGVVQLLKAGLRDYATECFKKGEAHG